MESTDSSNKYSSSSVNSISPNSGSLVKFDTLPDIVKQTINSFCSGSSKNKSLNKDTSDKRLETKISSFGSSNKKSNENFSKDNESIISHIEKSLNENKILLKHPIKRYKIYDRDLLIMKNSNRFNCIVANNPFFYKMNDYDCSICFRKVTLYGLLSNCNDVFCYECIKQWRSEAFKKNSRVMFRRCPICNEESPTMIYSKKFLVGEEKKKVFQEFLKKKIGVEEHMS